MSLLVLLLLFATTLSNAANPVKTPILLNQMSVHTRPFAQLPPEKGYPAKIVCIESHPETNDLYVCTLTRIYRVTPGGKPTLYLDVAAAISKSTDRLLSTDNKKHGGVRSVAFHPNFKFNRLFYIAAVETRAKNPGRHVYVSDMRNAVADSVVLEFRHDSAINRAIPGSYRSVLRVGLPVYDHPIKALAFSGIYLYIAHGDASVQSATAGGGRRNDALGKILRIAPLARFGRPFTIPYTNPFIRNNTMKSEVWALGFRNPHTLCFARDGTLFSADAGRANAEEVNIVWKGRDYGWPEREGTFVHKGGGIISGIRPLPPDDAKNKFVYPVAQVGHEGPFRAGWVGQAIAGGCPVENGSPMSGAYFYSDFPETGKLFFSNLNEIAKARTTGPPWLLTQARTRQAKIFFDHDGNPKTKLKLFQTLGDVVRSQVGPKATRVDLRFGRGKRGELYWSSKTTGMVYLFTSSLRGGPGGRPS